MTSPVSGRAWMLYALMAVLWGIPYLFIKEAVATFSPPEIVAGRTLLAAAILVPFAWRQRALGPALRVWPWVLAFGAIEMAGPFVLLSHAEKTISSGLTGLLVATVPLFATIIAVIRGDRSMLTPWRVGGLLIGFAGVAVIVSAHGLAVSGPESLVAIGEVLLVAVLYAIAPFIISSRLQGVPALGSVTLSLIAVGLFYLPIALLMPHEPPTVRSAGALVLLAVLCTAAAFIGFFALIREVGPVRAPLFTYVNPVVAIVLGILILNEEITVGLLLGFPLVLLGCWLAATGGQIRSRRRRHMARGA